MTTLPDSVVATWKRVPKELEGRDHIRFGTCTDSVVRRATVLRIVEDGADPREVTLRPPDVRVRSYTPELWPLWSRWGFDADDIRDWGLVVHNPPLAYLFRRLGVTVEEVAMLAAEGSSRLSYSLRMRNVLGVTETTVRRYVAIRSAAGPDVPVSTMAYWALSRGDEAASLRLAVSGMTPVEALSLTGGTVHTTEGLEMVAQGNPVEWVQEWEQSSGRSRNPGRY